MKETKLGLERYKGSFLKPITRYGLRFPLTLLAAWAGTGIGCKVPSPSEILPVTPPAANSSPKPKETTTTSLVNVVTGVSNLELPFRGKGHLTGGGHSDGLSAGVRYALDFASPAVYGCPGSDRAENWPATATASGKVTVVGNEKDSNDPNHSIVEINHGQLSSEYFHLKNIQVMVGQEVKAGDLLGDPSCEFPKGGSTSGIHLHFGLKLNGQFMPINEAILSGWRVINGAENYQGRMEKDGQVVIASTGRQGNELESPFPSLPRSGGAVPQVLGLSITPTKIPTKVPTVVLATPTPTLENRAGRIVFEDWARTFFNIQNKSGMSLRMKILQLNGKDDIPVTVVELVNRLISNINNSLSFSWVESYLSTTAGRRVIYNLGQAEIQQVHFQHVRKDALSNADIANGYQYRGRERITFLSRWQGFLQGYPEGTPIPAINFQGQPYSLWKDSEKEFNIEMRNGNWTWSWAQGLYIFPVDEPLGNMSDLIFYTMFRGLRCPDAGCRAPQDLPK